MSNDLSLRVSSPPALYDEEHATGDIVVVTRGGHAYHGRILAKMTNGGYLVDPIAFHPPTMSRAAA